MQVTISKFSGALGTKESVSNRISHARMRACAGAFNPYSSCLYLLRHTMDAPKYYSYAMRLRFRVAEYVVNLRLYRKLVTPKVHGVFLSATLVIAIKEQTNKHY